MKENAGHTSKFGASSIQDNEDMSAISVVLDVPVDDLGRRGSVGAVFAVTSKLTTLLLTLGSQVVLGRWLSPSDYGLYAMGLTALNFLLIFREFGLQTVGVQKRNLSYEEASFLFWVNVIFIICIGIAGGILAPLVATFYSEPKLFEVLIIMLFASVLGGLSAQHTMLLRRQMKYSKIAVAEIVALASGIGGALIVGYFYPDIRALLTLYVVQQATLTAMTVLLSGWLPKRPCWVNGAGDMLRFAIGITVANLLYFVTNNISTILIGYSLHGSVLGQFNRAQQLYLLPSSLMASSIYLVVFGSLSRLAVSSDLYKWYYQTALTRVSIIFFSVAGFLIVTGDDVVSLVLGPNWGLGGTLLKIMAFGLIGAGSAQMTGLLLQSQARLAEFQFWSVVDGVIRISSIFIGSLFGILGIAVAFAVSTTLITAPASLWFVGRKGPVTLIDQLYSLRPSVIVLILSAVGALIPRYMVFEEAPFVRLASSSIGSAIFILVGMALFPLTRRSLSDLLDSLKNIGK